MGGIEFMCRPLVAARVPRRGFVDVPGSQARDEALARWEDDGGRVLDRQLSLSPGPMPNTGQNRAQRATAR